MIRNNNETNNKCVNHVTEIKIWKYHIELIHYYFGKLLAGWFIQSLLIFAMIFDECFVI